MSKDDINPADVPPVKPNLGGSSSEYVEHGLDPKDGVRFIEKAYFGNEGEKA